MKTMRIAFLFFALNLSHSSPAFAAPHLAAPELERNPSQAFAGEYKIDPAHTSVTIKMSHDGMSNYTLRFNKIAGHYTFDPAHPLSSSVAVAIDPKSIDTGDADFNVKIARQFLDATSFPTITFTSSRIRAEGDHGTVEGVLDLHGVKKPVVLDVIYHGFFVSETWPGGRMGFSGTAHIKRSDFGVDFYAPAESDEMTVLIEAEFQKS